MLYRVQWTCWLVRVFNVKVTIYTTSFIPKILTCPQLQPEQISRFINARIAMKRINKLLSSAEISAIANDDPHCPISGITKKAFHFYYKLPFQSIHVFLFIASASVEIANGNIAWEENKHVLKNINLRINRGELVAVVGSVGCGKTTLLSALLGETICEGSVKRQVRFFKQLKKLLILILKENQFLLQGTVAYVPQQAWIQNLSLKENILFGDELDEERYREIIEGCALEPDLKLLPAADLTEIGEKVSLIRIE